VALELALYLAANLVLFSAVLLRSWNVRQPDRVRSGVLRCTLVPFIVLQGVALAWSTAVAGLQSIAHPWLATMAMLEATIVLCLLHERNIGTRAPSAVVVTLSFLIHSYGLVIAPLPVWQDTTSSPFARSPWYVVQVFSALVACGAYVCAAGGAMVQTVALLPRWGDSATRADLQRDGRAFSRGALTFALPWLTGSIFANAVWTYLTWGSYWSWRPAGVVLSIVWLILVITLHARTRLRWERTIWTLLTLLGLVLVLASLPVLGQGMITTM
jgi:ABC-type transport system involved in cytochrome c biogenesis permease subunit